MSRLKAFDIRQHGRVILIVLAALVVANVAVRIGVVNPRAAERVRLENDALPRITEYREFKTYVDSKEAFRDALEQAKGDLTTLRNDVLSIRHRRMVPVQVEIARLAERFRINLEEVRTENEVLDDEELDYMRMVVPLEGGYENLRQFIQAVENSEEFLVIEQVAIDEATDGSALLELNITLATYFDLPPAIRERLERRGDRRRRT